MIHKCFTNKQHKRNRLTFFAQPTNGDPGLLATHDEIWMMFGHDCYWYRYNWQGLVCWFHRELTLQITVGIEFVHPRTKSDKPRLYRGGTALQYIVLYYVTRVASTVYQLQGTSTGMSIVRLLTWPNVYQDKVWDIRHSVYRIPDECGPHSLKTRVPEAFQVRLASICWPWWAAINEPCARWKLSSLHTMKRLCRCINVDSWCRWHTCRRGIGFSDAPLKRSGYLLLIPIPCNLRSHFILLSLHPATVTSNKGLDSPSQFPSTCVLG